jgi:hypothetical protein
MALGAFQASLNILIHYERFYNGFYVPYIHIQLLGCNTKITDKLKLNVVIRGLHGSIFSGPARFRKFYRRPRPVVFRPGPAWRFDQCLHQPIV